MKCIIAFEDIDIWKRTDRMRIAFLLLLFFLSFSGFATIYQWKDENGVMVFSDVRHQDAKEVNLAPIKTYQSQISQSLVVIKRDKKESTDI